MAGKQNKSPSAISKGTLDMASPLKFSMFSACVLVLCVVVAAQYGDGGSSYGSGMPEQMPGMPMGPAPQSSAAPRKLTYPAIITILLPFMLTFLVAKERI
ncbi:hypothetical protein E2542_SST06082 [Spatholobus suberectus]|nr:hypothetical protein E2542_SST06082 [Spatholobus suberectus]